MKRIIGGLRGEGSSTLRKKDSGGARGVDHEAGFGGGRHYFPFYILWFFPCLESSPIWPFMSLKLMEGLDLIMWSDFVL